jgi:hypothetical protein
VRSSYARPHCQARPRPPASIGAVYPLGDVRSEAQRRVLALLARIPNGIAEGALVVAHRFDRTFVACLSNSVHDVGVSRAAAQVSAHEFANRRPRAHAPPKHSRSRTLLRLMRGREAGSAACAAMRWYRRCPS